MLRVYNWMSSGLLLTAIISYAVANTSLRDAFYQPVVGSFGQMVMRPTALSTICMFAPLGFVLVLSFGVNRLSRSTAQALYWAFCATMGASLANIFLVYTQGSIASTFLVTAGMFAGMIFAFIHSFDDVNLSLFIARPGERPLTVAILSFLEFGFAPTLAAVSILSMLIPLALVALFGRFVGIGEFLYQEAGNG